MFDVAIFEESAKSNGIRYWLAHEFMLSLGYDSWVSFKAVIQKAQAACLQLGIDTEDVFISYELEDGTKSYKLTRFACYLVAMQADSKKQNVAEAQIVLAKIAELLIEDKISEGGIARIEERSKLTTAEKQLAGVAHSAGLELSKDFAIFKDSGFRGMYNMSLQKLQKYKGAPEGKTLYDYMGLTELAANTFRVTQTAERMKRSDSCGLRAAAGTAFEVGKEVREIMIKSSIIAPEDLTIEEPIGKVKKQIKIANKEILSSMTKCDKNLSRCFIS